jgi:hypothetical protein
MVRSIVVRRKRVPNAFRVRVECRWIFSSRSLRQCFSRECIHKDKDNLCFSSNRVFAAQKWRPLRDLALNGKLPQRREKPGKLTTITTLLRTTTRSVAAPPLRRISGTTTATITTTTMARTPITTTLLVEVVVVVLAVVVVGE